MKFFARTLALCATFILASVSYSHANVKAVVDISMQQMIVFKDGRELYTWPVSTARKGKRTPRGTWSAKWLSENHRSSRYNNAPMPYSIFYDGNYAVHGTDQVGRLGRPASAGCVRLHPQNAAILFKMAQQVGLQNFTVTVQK
jgi:lipoprotein-anchoring transpeptidase ErfK/SrfK